jgi:hypothetical protein
MKTQEDLMAEEWRNAGFRIVGGGRPYWTQKLLMCRGFAVIYAAAFGFVGYCLGSDHGIAAETLFGLTLGLFGALLGYGSGLVWVYSGMAIASWKLKKRKSKKIQEDLSG